MDVFLIHTEFNWVNKVLFSSQTNKHIECSVKLFNNFMNKWRFEMTEDLKITFNRDFSENCLFQSEKIVSL
jgi:NADPH-dependent 7-cyano-7-deazaguanine reductase QueF-like protein